MLDIWPFIWDNRIQLLSKFLLCKLPGSSQRGSSMSQPCSTHHGFVATLYIPGVCAQLSESGHNAGKQLVVLGTRYEILWRWYGQFVVGLSQPPQLWSCDYLSMLRLKLIHVSKSGHRTLTIKGKMSPSDSEKNGLQPQKIADFIKAWIVWPLFNDATRPSLDWIGFV